MMTLQEFRAFCENRTDLIELWNNLAVCALKFRQQKSKAALRSRQKGAMLREELVLLKELEDNFISAKDELCDVCAAGNILAPSFNLNEICDLYS